jgi:lipopolysaccharide/colanic/teichoic acid biosynthesis glycosyltransferase
LLSHAPLTLPHATPGTPALWPVPEVLGSKQRFSEIAALRLHFDQSAFAAAPDERSDKSREKIDWSDVSRVAHELRTNSLGYRLAKRALDMLCILLTLPLSVPLLFIIAAVVKISSPGPIFYRQMRLGRFGDAFPMWKFRTMHVDADNVLDQFLRTHPDAKLEWDHHQKLRQDPRLTPAGAFLRRSSLDELPQLFNVLLGSMSLVGPRPILANEVPRYSAAYFFYASAKPGLTGLWQVSGRSGTSYESRVHLDEHYVRNWRMSSDLHILLKTVSTVLRAEGAY